MSHDIANPQAATAAPFSPAQIANMLLPDLSGAILEAVQHAVAMHTSPTMSREDFISVNSISASVLEKWISG
ncbi:hypothetical protein D9980_09225 [Serratia sp. 3ACOL1]|uniref:hypothetical protein n=1 Tax=Serratia sp. 3ACOL1 TaxID=2448483 RepID=UPI000EF47C50|nr:hypothetical protein [Serratia sp. 3ACOL1]AYM90751.1 hypothetical protein D9980_09225 [Serratia sp. 3ACOL1]